MINKIAHITDLHLDEEFTFRDKISVRKRFDDVFENIRQNGISQIICTGDIGENDGILYFFEKHKEMDLSITLGNHDKLRDINKHYNLGSDYGTSKIYRSEIQNQHKFIFLDSSSGNIDLNQLKWLIGELITPEPIMIFVHHPIIGLPLKVDEIGKLTNREELIRLLEKVPNQITIFCGHYHIESTLVYKNIKQYITPAIAFQIEKKIDSIEIDSTVSGYRIIQFNNYQHSTEVKMISNAN